MLKPIMMMIIFSVVFSKIVRFEVSGPYSVFLLCGLLPWNFLSMSLSAGTNGLLDHANLIKKVFLPAESFILAICLANLVDLYLAFVVYMGFVFIFHVKVTVFFLLFPVIVFIHSLFVLGLCLALSSANVFYRDVRQMLEVVLLAWFYVSPVIYPISQVPKEFVGIYMTNPMALFISLYRDVVFHGIMPPWTHLFVGVLWGVGSLVLGYSVFLKYEERYPELV
jgi:lipopolysaccharide transport system permease protein